MPLKMPVKYVAASREKVLGNLRRAYILKPDFAKSKLISERLLRETTDANTRVGTFLNLARIASLMKNPEEALAHVDMAIESARGIKDDIQLAQMRLIVGTIYLDLAGEDKLRIALNFFLQAKKAAEKANNKKFLADISGQIGMVLLKQGQHAKKIGKLDEVNQKLEESLKIRYHALELLKETSNIGGIGSTYAGIAVVKQEQGKLDEAIEIIEKFCIPLAKTQRMVGVNFHNLGDFYRLKRDLKKALGYTLRGRTIFEEINYGPYLSAAIDALKNQLNVSEILSSIDLTEEEEKRVARVRVAELKSLDEAANELGLSVQRIKEIEEKIIGKLLS